jgi:hypothetical protein
MSLFGDVAVIAAQLLLGAQLDAEVRHLRLAALAVLAGAIFALVDRALGTSEDVFAHAAVEFILGAGTLAHDLGPICLFNMSRTAPPTPGIGRTITSPGCEVDCEGVRLGEGGAKVKLGKQTPGVA